LINRELMFLVVALLIKMKGCGWQLKDKYFTAQRSVLYYNLSIDESSYLVVIACCRKVASTFLMSLLID
jgi:hypothetical protein